MQHAQSSTANTTAWPALAWSPATWFPNVFAPGEASSGRPNGDPKGPLNSIESMLQGMAQGSNPWLKAVAQTNIEMMGLMTRRSQALMEVSAKASQCRQPQDILGLQTQFWQAAYQEHTEATKRIVTAWGSVVPMAGAIAGSIGQMVPAQAANTVARDVIAIGESKDPLPAATTQPPRPQGDRRTAA